MNSTPYTLHPGPSGLPARHSSATSRAGVSILLALLASGCVAHPGGVIVTNWGWRSAQAGSCTNVFNTIEGGGKPNLEVHP